MDRLWPRTRLPIGAALGIKHGLRACWMLLLLGAGIVCAAAQGAQQPKDNAAGATVKQTVADDFVGADVCASCHDAEAKGFGSNPHSRLALQHGGTGATCESCHGPGKAHVDGGGDVTKIFNPAKATPKELDDKCLTCHAGAHPNFGNSPHAKAGLSCISCHSVHASKAETLLKAAQPALCYQCHADQKAQFNMPIHHRVNEGLISCTDCHDVHGTFGPNNLRSTADQNAVCTKCHTDVRGPFVYEHAPVKTEGCLACHTPHGTQNPRLLNMPSIATLCNQCHSPLGAGARHGLDPGSTTVTPCVTCHTFIHGSNASQAFIR
jgi:DmsE family decaheme c-type cytochrome